MEINRPQFIVIHHSKSPDNIVRNFDEIKKYHIEVRGFENIGYHKIIERIGDRYEIVSGRNLWDHGAHALGFNTISIGICVVGDYDLYPIPLPMAQRLIKLIKALQLTFNIKNDKVIGHRETYGLRGLAQEKTCPGKMVYMEDIRQSLYRYEK